jgi:hypothetical protein
VGLLARAAGPVAAVPLLVQGIDMLCRIAASVSSSGHVLADVPLGQRVTRDALRSVAMSEGLGLSRLRRRSSWVNCMVDSLGLPRGLLGAFLMGRWTPDLIHERLHQGGAAWLAAMVEGGVKVLGGGLAKCKAPRTEGASLPLRQPFVVLDFGSFQLPVFVPLVAKLSCYAQFRERDTALLGSLRLRAQEWAKAESVADLDAAMCLPGSIALSFLVSVPEAGASQLLASRAASASVRGGVSLSFWERYAPWTSSPGGVCLRA